MQLKDATRKPVRGQTTAEAVATTLREAIGRGELAAGKALRTAKLAEELGVSRIPVREALQQLSSEGLVTLYPNRGAVVTVLSADDVQEIYDLRQLLESEALRRHAPRLSAHDFGAAEVLLGEMVRTGDADRWGELDREFQALLFGLARPGRLQELIESLRRHVDRYATLYGLAFKHRRLFEEQHRALLLALQRGETERAVDLLRRQLGDTASMLTAEMNS